VGARGFRSADRRGRGMTWDLEVGARGIRSGGVRYLLEVGARGFRSGCARF
jgi:hypothetical protein